MQLYNSAFRDLLSEHIKAFRQEQSLSQEAMAATLHISTRSYSDIENKKSLCSTRTFILYQVSLSEDEMIALWKAFKAALRQLDEQAAGRGLARQHRTQRCGKWPSEPVVLGLIPHDG